MLTEIEQEKNNKQTIVEGASTINKTRTKSVLKLLLLLLLKKKASSSLSIRASCRFNLIELSRFVFLRIANREKEYMRKEWFDSIRFDSRYGAVCQLHHSTSKVNEPTSSFNQLDLIFESFCLFNFEIQSSLGIGFPLNLRFPDKKKSTFFSSQESIFFVLFFCHTRDLSLSEELVTIQILLGPNSESSFWERVHVFLFNMTHCFKRFTSIDCQFSYNFDLQSWVRPWTWSLGKGLYDER